MFAITIAPHTAQQLGSIYTQVLSLCYFCVTILSFLINVMKNIHPEKTTAQVNCAGCGNNFSLSGAYYSDKFTVEQCSQCHTAFTGKRRMVGAGAVEKFNKKFGAFSSLAMPKKDDSE